MRILKSLRVFLAVVRYGSFSAASEHVSLTAAAVGLQMRTLEQELGFALFDRRGKSVALNYRGHQFATKAESIVALFNEAKYNQDARELSGSVRVLSISSSMQLLVRAMIAMRQTYPRIVVEAGVSYSGNLKQTVTSGAAAAALTVKSPHETHNDVIWTPLYDEPFAFVCSKKRYKGKSLAEILDGSIFFQSANNSVTGVLIEQLMRRNKIETRQAIQIDAVRSILDLVRDGHGVSILPLPRGFEIASYPQVQFRVFKGPDASRTVGFIENRNTSLLTSVLRHFLAAHV